MIKRSINYSLEEPNLRLYLLGTVLVAFSWLIVPVFTLIGYFIEVLTAPVRGEKDVPGFQDPIALTKNGIAGMGVIIVYSGIFIGMPFIIFASIGFVVPDHLVNIELFFILTSTGLFISIILMVFLLPILLAEYGRTNDFTSIYNIQRIGILLKTRAIAKVMLVVAGMTVVTVPIIVLVTALTLGIGVLLWPSLVFWYLLVTGHIYGTTIASSGV